MKADWGDRQASLARGLPVHRRNFASHFCTLRAAQGLGFRAPTPIFFLDGGHQYVWSLRMAPRPNWKGYLKLSLVSCSISLYPATSSSERVSFRQINKETGNRL